MFWCASVVSLRTSIQNRIKTSHAEHQPHIGLKLIMHAKEFWVGA